MNCEKCKADSSMMPTKVFRFSGCLVAIGVSLLVPSMLALGAATFCAVAGVFSGGSATVQLAEDLKREAISELENIPDLPDAVVSDFTVDGAIDEATLTALKPQQRRQAEAIESSFQAGTAGAALGGTAVAGVSIFGVLATYAAAIPTFIVGLVLVLRRGVWRCVACGYVFDRA